MKHCALNYVHLCDATVHLFDASVTNGAKQTVNIIYIYILYYIYIYDIICIYNMHI